MNTLFFWYRRDLRLQDNRGLFEALTEAQRQSTCAVQPIFIFDQDILSSLNNPEDRRLPFLHQTVLTLKEEFQEKGSDLWIFYGKPREVFQNLLKENQVRGVFCNHDYEPAALLRDQLISEICQKQGVQFQSFKDQVIFEKQEILTEQKKTYTVFTPYKKKWLASLNPFHLKSFDLDSLWGFLAKRPTKRVDHQREIPSLEKMGFSGSGISTPFPRPLLQKALLRNYSRDRDFPSLEGTSRLGLHLRFGTISIRELVREGQKLDETWVSELIWREFFMQILFQFPHVEKKSFRLEYEKVEWRENQSEFERWCEGQTGYPFVDAGMRELNATGWMHNRARMVVASFLSKHLLMHWLKGERYFARQLLDFDLAANNGNWQWAAGTGCDAAPYFRIFNPESQAQRFDPKQEYLRKWIPELGTSKYPAPLVDHKLARARALQAFQKALRG